MTLIFNASPLIILAKSGLLSVVLRLPYAIKIPQAVAEEVGASHDSLDASCLWLKTPAAVDTICAAPAPSEFVSAWGLGMGESSVIALAESLPDSIAVLDDMAARRCAAALNLPKVGTLGLLLMAKKAGFLSSICQALDAVAQAGLFISQKHIDEIRKRAGE